MSETRPLLTKEELGVMPSDSAAPGTEAKTHFLKTEPIEPTGELLVAGRYIRVYITDNRITLIDPSGDDLYIGTGGSNCVTIEVSQPLPCRTCVGCWFQRYDEETKKKTLPMGVCPAYRKKEVSDA